MTSVPKSSDELRHYVETTAAAIGLSIAAEDMPAVVAVFANLARVTEPLMEFPLPDDVEPSPVFTAGGAKR